MVKFERRRYLAFKVYTDGGEISGEKLAKEIWNSLIGLFGENSAAEVNFWLMYYDPKRGIGIARCTNRTVDLLRTAMTLISTIDGIRISIKTLKTSGTFRKLRKKYLLR